MEDLQQYLVILRKWWWLIVLGALLGGATGYTVSRFEPMVYQAKVTLIVGNLFENANPNSSELAISQQLAQSYAEILTREPILSATVSTLGLDTNWASLRQKINARLVPNTQLFEITVTDTNPELAQSLANEIARQLVVQSPTTVTPEEEAQHSFIKAELTELQESITAARQEIRDKEAALDLEVTVEGIQARQQDIAFLQARLESLQSTYASLLSFNQEQQVNNLSVIEPAAVPVIPINANSAARNGLMAAVFGLMLSFGVAFLVEHLDDTLRNSDDVERVLDLPTLSTVSYIKTIKSTGDPMVTNQDSFSPGAEAYRTLRTNIQFSSHGSSFKTLLVTSSMNSEGKSMTASNLAAVMAQANKSVILVDADLRRPVLHKIFKTSNRTGISNLLVNPHLELDSVLSQRKVSNLWVLPSGPLPPNPAELLSSLTMKDVLEKLKARAEIVIIDSPPLLPVTDASILATQTDATILVVEAGRTRSRECQRSRGVLAQVGIQPLGVVLNKFTPEKTDGGYYYYGYSPYSGQQSPRRRLLHK